MNSFGLLVVNADAGEKGKAVLLAQVLMPIMSGKRLPTAETNLMGMGFKPLMLAELLGVRSQSWVLAETLFQKVLEERRTAFWYWRHVVFDDPEHDWSKDAYQTT